MFVVKLMIFCFVSINIIILLQALMHHVALYIAWGRGAQIVSEVLFEWLSGVIETSKRALSLGK